MDCSVCAWENSRWSGSPLLLHSGRVSNAGPYDTVSSKNFVRSSTKLALFALWKFRQGARERLCPDFNSVLSRASAVVAVWRYSGDGRGTVPATAAVAAATTAAAGATAAAAAAAATAATPAVSGRSGAVPAASDVVHLRSSSPRDDVNCIYFLRLHRNVTNGNGYTTVTCMKFLVNIAPPTPDLRPPTSQQRRRAGNSFLPHEVSYQGPSAMHHAQPGLKHAAEGGALKAELAAVVRLHHLKPKTTKNRRNKKHRIWIQLDSVCRAYPAILRIIQSYDSVLRRSAEQLFRQSRVCLFV